MNLRVLVLGGVDPCGGAGITADARTLQWHGVLALAVPTAMTVQNRHGMQLVQAVEASLLQKMIEAVLDDGPVHAVKTGLLASAEQVERLAGWLAPVAARAPLVVDPVLSATAGGYAPGAPLAAAVRRWLLPMAALVTPNLPELAALAGGDPQALLADGCRAVLVKGGHGQGSEVHDVLHTASGTRTFAHTRLTVGPVHGTGCAYASTVAARLAQGDDIATACGTASAFLFRCLLAMGAADGGGLPRPLQLTR